VRNQNFVSFTLVVINEVGLDKTHARFVTRIQDKTTTETTKKSFGTVAKLEMSGNYS